MEKLKALLNELQMRVPHQAMIDQTISKGSVGWHIEHTLLTFNLIIETMQKSNPTDYKWKLNWPKIFVFAINKIPRGKAKSPTSVQPTIDFNEHSLTNHISIAKEKLNQFESLHHNSHFKHPFFGKLNKKPTIKFLGIHTKHHLKIIDDIIKSKSK